MGDTMSNVKYQKKTNREMKKVLAAAARDGCGETGETFRSWWCDRNTKWTFLIFDEWQLWIYIAEIYRFLDCYPQLFLLLRKSDLHGSRLHPSWRKKENLGNSCSFTPRTLRTGALSTPARDPAAPRRTGQSWKKLAPWRRCKQQLKSWRPTWRRRGDWGQRQ